MATFRAAAFLVAVLTAACTTAGPGLAPAQSAGEAAPALRSIDPDVERHLAAARYKLAINPSDIPGARQDLEAAVAASDGAFERGQSLMARSRLKERLGDLAGAADDLERALAEDVWYPTERTSLASRIARLRAPDDSSATAAAWTNRGTGGSCWRGGRLLRSC